MAVDIYIGKSKEARKKKRYSFLDDEVHKKLFEKIDELRQLTRIGQANAHYALLSRLRDPYADYSYHPAELDQLSIELLEMQNNFQGDAKVLDALKNFIAACRDARNGELHIFTFGD